MKHTKRTHRRPKKCSKAVVKCVKHVLKTELAPEMKQNTRFHGTAYQYILPSGGSINTTNYASFLHEIVLGTGPNNRIGKQIKIHKIDFYVELQYYLQAVLLTNGPYVTRVRCCLIKDKKFNGALGLPQLIFQADTSNVLRIDSDINNLFENRFSIVKDFKFRLSYGGDDNYATLQPLLFAGNGGAEGVPAHKSIKITIRPNVVINYVNSTPDISDVIGVNYYLVLYDEYGQNVYYNAIMNIHFTDV